MEAELRGGLSFGLSGFAFWSHDIGGFVQPSPESLYRRWLPFGFLSSHSRAHGAPPKEPWLYNASFVKAFREAAELKYKLMPYVYAQAKHCTEAGLPMVRALFVEFPEDPGAWNVEDAYLFGSDIYVAPLMEDTKGREVYLPGKDTWIDYQTGRTYSSGWNLINAGEIPCIILVRQGAAIPHAALAQSTDKIDWKNIYLRVYGNAPTAKGLLCIPMDNKLIKIELTKRGNKYELSKGGSEGINFKVN
jgi:alpha-D-xyloside xylohydrolase